jgi:HupE / UreJ protein
MRPVCLRVTAVLGILLTLAAHAHTTSTGLASLTLEDHLVTYRLALSLSDMLAEPAQLIGRAIDGDSASAGQVATLLGKHVRVSIAGKLCRPGRVQVQGSRLGDERAVLLLHLTCPEGNGRLELTDELSTVFGEHYRSIASLQGADGTHEERVLEAGNNTARFDLESRTPRSGWTFLLLGIEHILTGVDHLLFLAALLLGVRGLGPVLVVVTAFTVAHSFTLAAAALGWIVVPGRIIEPLIAASIAWVAVENLLGTKTSSRRWLVSFGFGLIHGFGFASALAEVELTGWALVQALIGFNAGVEVGQAVVALVLVPLFAWLARRRQWPAILRTASIALAVIGVVWCVVRLI